MHIENKINNINELPLTLNVSHISKVLGISITLAYELCHRNDFPCYRVGKRRLIIPRPAFQKWLESGGI